MSAVTSSQAPGSTASGLAAIPKAMWAVLGALALATAGLAGALVTRSVDEKPAPVAVSSQTAPTQVAAAPIQAQPAPAQLQAAPQAPVEATPAPAAKPAPARVVAKPAPAPVRQATGSAAQTQAQAPVETPARTVTPIET